MMTSQLAYSARDLRDWNGNYIRRTSKPQYMVVAGGSMMLLGSLGSTSWLVEALTAQLTCVFF